MGEGSEQCLKLQMLGRAVTGVVCLSCFLSEEGSFPVFPQQNLLLFPETTHRPLILGLGEGEELQPL